MNPGTAIALSNNYTLLRTLTTQVAETDPPVLGSFGITTQAFSFVDVLFAMTAMAGGVVADSFTFNTYRLISPSTIEKIDSITVDSSLVSVPFTRTLPCGTDKIWSVVTFSGGTTPNISGSIYVRPILDGSITQSKLSTDASGYLLNRSAAYDPSSNAEKSVLVRDVSDQYLKETLCVQAGTAVVAGTYDINMAGYSTLSMVVYGQSDVAGVNLVYVNVQQCNDTSGTPRYSTITSSVFDSSSNTVLIPDASGNVAMPTTVSTQCWYLTDLACEVIRLNVSLAVTTDADNKLEIFAYKKF